VERGSSDGKTGHAALIRRYWELKLSILTRLFGIVAQDHEAKFYKYGTRHATCGEHLSRELKGMDELCMLRCAGRKRSFMLEMNEQKKEEVTSIIFRTFEIPPSERQPKPPPSIFAVVAVAVGMWGTRSVIHHIHSLLRYPICVVCSRSISYSLSMFM